MASAANGAEFYEFGELRKETQKHARKSARLKPFYSMTQLIPGENVDQTPGSVVCSVGAKSRGFFVSLRSLLPSTGVTGLPMADKNYS